MKREFKYPYVQITSDGVIRNIAMFDNYEQANVITRATYGSDAVAVAYRYGVEIGDRYVDGVFYVVDEDGTTSKAEYIPNDEDNIRDLKEENETLSAELTDTQLALVEQYEANMALEEQLTNTQLALCEIYEGSVS